VTLAAAASSAQAQSFQVGPVSVNLGGHSHSGRSYRPKYDYYRPQVSDPFRSRRSNPYQRPIYNGPSQLDNLSYDPVTGRWVANVNSETVYESATDPDRDVVDPGSLRTRVLSTVDANGNQVNKTITSWTSYGVPHSNTTTQVVCQAGDLTVIDEHHALRSVAPTTSDSDNRP
jgi:hypothetical protein